MRGLQYVFVLYGAVFLLVFVVIAVVGWWYRRVDCCVPARRWGVWSRRCPQRMVRVTRLAEPLDDVSLLPYLQHLVELEMVSCDSVPIGRDKKHPFSPSVLTLRLNNSPELLLTSDTLPPRLTSLSLAAIKNTPLPVGVLPQSLTSLQLAYGFDTRWSIGPDVLPSELQRLSLHEWTLPLSDIALPASLIELDIRWLSNHPLPALPTQLQVLRIGGAFNQPLAGVLLPALRSLKLTGHFTHPLTAEMFAATPQLEELHLSDKTSGQAPIFLGTLPRSLHVLRLGKSDSFAPYAAEDVPPQLHRLILSGTWAGLRIASIQQQLFSRGFTRIAVVQETPWT